MEFGKAGDSAVTYTVD